MAKTVSISEDSIMAVLKDLPEDVLVELLSRVLVQSDSSPLTDDELRSYQVALREHGRGEAVKCEDLM